MPYLWHTSAGTMDCATQAELEAAITLTSRFPSPLWWEEVGGVKIAADKVIGTTDERSVRAALQDAR